LQESEKVMYDTRPFCDVYTYEGKPVRVGEQMDVEEFFNMLFDRLESAMKDKPQVCTYFRCEGYWVFCVMLFSKESSLHK
jgi:hypothetical protein